MISNRRRPREGLAMKRTSLKKCREIVANLQVTSRGFASSDYTDSIKVKKSFLVVEDQGDGALVRVDWDAVEDWAQEVAARSLFEYVNGPGAGRIVPSK